jgi:hypothetical protein
MQSDSLIVVLIMEVGVIVTVLVSIWVWDRIKRPKKNSMVWVRERTIPTERPPLVGEVIANFCG